MKGKRPNTPPPMALMRQGVYQAAGGALFAGAVALVVMWLHPAPKVNKAAASCPTQASPSTQQARVYG